MKIFIYDNVTMIKGNYDNVPIMMHNDKLF